MKRDVIRVLMIFCFIIIVGVNMSAKQYDFVGVWNGSNPDMGTENTIRHEITQSSWTMISTIYSDRGPSTSVVDMDIISVSTRARSVRTKVNSTNGMTSFNVGDIINWQYSIKKNELRISFYKEGTRTPANEIVLYSTDSNNIATDDLEPFYGAWLWKEGASQEMFTISLTDSRSDLATLEIDAAYSGKKGFALFEISSYKVESNHMLLKCIALSGALPGFKPGSKWYFTYSISGTVAYFAFNKNEYPKSAKYGPYNRQ